MLLENRVYPQPSRPNNPSALEITIYNYELKAKKYHDQRLKSNNSKETKGNMKRDFDHLQREKIRITNHVLLQENLEEYRDDCKNSDIEKLEIEAHHPTEKLARFLNAIGEPKPTIMHEAHHIVCGKGRYRQALMLRARFNLHIQGIGINDPVNGTWLINFNRNKQQDWATAEAPAHRKIHRYNYETWIGTNLGQSELVDKTLFFNRLLTIKVQIKTGTMPTQVLEAKDELWKGV